MESIGNKKSMKIIPPGKKKCIWMEAGVVSYKLCDNNYDCSTCIYDHAMQVKVARQKEAIAVKPLEAQPERINETWVEKMMQLPALKRKCRYMITGEVSRKICPNAYECGNCSFDQMMQERLQAEVLPVYAQSNVGGFELAEDIYYHEGHTWVKPEYGGRVRIGFNDFCQKILGRHARVNLPNIGQELNQGEVGFQITRYSDIAQVMSPIDGIVSHVNHQLQDCPDLVNSSPYENGWLFIVEPTNLRKNLKGLYFGEDVKNFICEERERLFSMAHEKIGIAADGGVSTEDIFEEIEEKDWTKFVKIFLKS